VKNKQGRCPHEIADTRMMKLLINVDDNRNNNKNNFNCLNNLNKMPVMECREDSIKKMFRNNSKANVYNN
jgi:hypothetical protein